MVYHQGQVFKRFKEKKKFAKPVGELGITKTTIIFRIKVFKLCKKHPKLLKSSIGLFFFLMLSVLSFKIKSVAQVFITDIQAKICIHFELCVCNRMH